MKSKKRARGRGLAGRGIHGREPSQKQLPAVFDVTHRRRGGYQRANDSGITLPHIIHNRNLGRPQQQPRLTLQAMERRSRRPVRARAKGPQVPQPLVTRTAGTQKNRRGKRAILATRKSQNRFRAVRHPATVFYVTHRQQQPRLMRSYRGEDRRTETPLHLDGPKDGLAVTSVLLSMLDNSPHERKLKRRNTNKDRRRNIRRYCCNGDGSFTVNYPVIELVPPPNISGRLIAVLSSENLGAGSYGKVKRTRYAIHVPKTGEPRIWPAPVCVKIIENSSEYRRSEGEFFINAVNEERATNFYLQAVKGKHGFGTFFRRSRVNGTKSYFSQPEAQGSVTLAECCRDCYVEPAGLLAIIEEIARQLQIIHRKYIHCDLKPANILINPDTKEVTIVDFGLAVKPGVGDNMATPYFQCFELLRLEPKQLDYKIDIFSLTMTLFDLCKTTYADGPHLSSSESFGDLRYLHDVLAADKNQRPDQREYSSKQRESLIIATKNLLDKQIEKVCDTIRIAQHMTAEEAGTLREFCTRNTALDPTERDNITDFRAGLAELRQTIEAREAEEEEEEEEDSSPALEYGM